ncbi:MAG: aquaporin [Holosporales bacterium]|jgi:aquaporin Z|nr:aquaporin [Holosporales bacterium]
MCVCKKYVAEFIGTFLLVFLGCGSAVFAGGQIGWLGVSLVFGITLMACAYIFGGISGCHLNPAVTGALLLSKRFPAKDFVGYIVSQMAGASLAGLVLYIIASGAPQIDVNAGLALNGLASHSPTGCSFCAGFLGEVVGTITLLLVILLATTKNVPEGFAPIAIGGALFVSLIFLIPLTNGSLNVARSFGVALFYGGWALSQLLWFAAAHIVAVVGAVYIGRFLNSECKVDSRK